MHTQRNCKQLHASLKTLISTNNAFFAFLSSKENILLFGRNCLPAVRRTFDFSHGSEECEIAAFFGEKFYSAFRSREICQFESENISEAKINASN
jgi:hypothetical protein